ncbi:MAG: PAS domain S-box protein, partial [Desulfobacteraceae bacterium]|nr:PAS domain S-box protein [Desulfobacteraceae bacterium]
MPKKNILIADDEEDIRKLLVRVLKNKGYRFFLAENGKEAVDIAKNNPIDLALLDIKMPLLDGQETLKRIKKIDQTIEVIMLTGYGNLESLKEMIVEHGAYDYLSKPMDMENIKHCIKNALEKRELRRRRNVEKQELQDRISQMERDFKEQTYKLRESQIRYRNIVENANDAIVVSQEGYLRFANGIALELSGYTREEILKIPFLEIIHPDDRETVNETYIRRLSGEDVSPFDLFRVLRKDGTFFWVENHAVKTMFEDKPCVLNILRDITERIEAEQELRESEHRYRGIFEQATDSIVVLDLQTGVIVDFNDSAHENLGYTREEFSGLKISDIEALESPAAVRKRSKKFIKDKQAEFETRHRKKDGQVRDIDVRARVISLGGKEYGFAIWRDITNEKKYQETMKIKDAALATAVNGVALADLEGNLTYANKAFVEMWGYAEEGEIIGMSAQRIVNMDARAMEALDELRDKGSWMGQITAVRKDGSSFDVQ